MSGTEDAWGDVRIERPRAAPVREGDVIQDKYVAQGMLGAGGMGVVIAAKDKVLGRTVAIKFLASLATEAACERFLREAKASTRITSEHGVRLIDHGTLPNGLPFLVMEHLEGQTLKALLEESGPFPRARAVDFLMQALQAIAEAHSKNVVHRDIKPSNLFLTRRADGTELIKVLDFGIAKIFEAETASGITGSQDTRLGSLPYMSPEQLIDPRSVDRRADIWAAGATLYEFLCGKTPFAAAGHYDMVARMMQAGHGQRKLRYPELDVPAGLNRVIARCLNPDRARRYQSVTELAVALAPFGSSDAQHSLSRIRGFGRADTPVSDSAPGVTRDVAKGSNARRAAVAAAALASVVGLGVAIERAVRSEEPAPTPQAEPPEPAARGPEPPALPLATATALPESVAEPPPSAPSASISNRGESGPVSRRRSLPAPSASTPPRVSSSEPLAVSSVPQIPREIVEAIEARGAPLVSKSQNEPRSVAPTAPPE